MMSASENAPPPPTTQPHPRFFFSDGNILLLVEGILYCVHRSRVTSICPVLSELLEQPDEALLPGWESRLLRTGEAIYVHWTSRVLTYSRPVVWDDGALILSDVTARQFDALLSVIYPINLVTYDLNTSEDWEAALSLATRWSCTSIVQLALHHLHTYWEASPVERLALARTHNIQDWIRPARRALCLRPHSFTADELRRLRSLPDDLEFIMRTREQTRSGNERAVDSALDAWERTAAAIPEPDAEELASPPAPLHLSLDLLPPADAPTSVPPTTVPAIPDSALQAPVEPVYGTTTLHLNPIGLAFEADNSTSNTLSEDPPIPVIIGTEDTSLQDDTQGECVSEVATVIDIDAHSGASTTIVNASETVNADDDGEAAGASGLLNFVAPSVQSSEFDGTHESTADLPGGQLAEDVALSPIDDRFDGSAMQSRAMSPHDEEEFDPARPPARSTASVTDSPTSSRGDPPRSAGGSWIGHGPGAAWSARSSSDGPPIPGAHKDDSISRTASSSAAAVSSPMKTFLGFVASTAGLLTGSGSVEPRRARSDSAPESGRQDKGKGRQMEPENTSNAVVVVGPNSATEATASSWRPSREPQTSGRPSAEGQVVEEDAGDGEDAQDGGEDAGEGGDDPNAGASTSQQAAPVIDPYQGMTQGQRKRAKERAKDKAKRDEERAKREERKRLGRK